MPKHLLRPFALWLVSSLLVSESSVCHAAAAELVMKALPVDETAQPKIIGGKRAIPADWPATLVFTDPTGGSCTSTVVGPRTVLTAAHCISPNAAGRIELNGENIEIVCTQHPQYHPELVTSSDSYEIWLEKVSADFALCFATKDIAGIPFERIKADSPGIARGTMIHLLGFGCNEEGGTDNGFGVLYEGDTKVVEMPSVSSYFAVAEGGAAVCFGDSGGGAYLLHRSSAKRRLLVGVNSRGNIKTTSYLAITGLEGFRDWADQAAKAHSTVICGVSPTAANCRPF